METIHQLAGRTKQELLAGAAYVMSICMDLAAADCDIPMDLDRLLNADGFNFLHDVGGITRHINRTTGKLEDCFVPRYALSRRPANVALRPSWLG